MTQNLFFIVIATLMCLFAMLLVLPAFFRSQHYHSEDDQNVAAARERLDDLNARLAAGEIDAAAAGEYEQEVKSQLLTEAGGWRQLSAATGRDKLGIILSVIALVAIAPLLYITLATPAALNAPTNVEAMIAQMELRVAQAPDDLSSLLLLARMLAAHDRSNEALAYYDRVRKLAGDPPALLAEQVNVLLQHRPDDSEISVLLEKGLATAPQHPMLLWLAGVHAKNQDDYTEALSYWRRSYGNLADDPEQQQMVAAAIADLEQQFGTTHPPSTADDEQAVSSGTVLVTVNLAAGIDIDPETTLFVFAKATEGPAMPLAVHRGVVEDLPLTVQLDDSLAMMPAMKMSNFDSYDIIARLSSGDGVSAQSGDWFGMSTAQPGDKIALLIDRRIP